MYYIQQAVISKYKTLVNPIKIEGLSDKEVLFKIKCDLDLGKRVYTKKNGDYLIHYFDLVFVISNFRCVNVYRDKFNNRYIVPNDVKRQYFNELIKEIA